MLWLIFGVLTLFFGIWALIKGQLKLSNKFILEGNQARIAGVVLVISPLIGAIFYFIGQGDLSYIFGSSCYGIIAVLAFAAFQAWKSKRSPQVEAQKEKEPAVSRNKNPTPPQGTQRQLDSSSNSSNRKTPDSKIKTEPEQNDLSAKDLLEPELSAITTCPYCGMEVLPNSDGTCPNCLARLST